MSTKFGGGVDKKNENKSIDYKINKYRFKIEQFLKKNPGLLEKLSKQNEPMYGGSYTNNKIIKLDSELFIE